MQFANIMLSKKISAGLALVLAISIFTSCGNKGNLSSTEPTEPTTEVETTTEETSKAHVIETHTVPVTTTKNEYNLPEESPITLSDCEMLVSSFLSACKMGNVEKIIELSDSSYYISNWTDNKDELSTLLKYMFSDLEWEFGLDNADQENQEYLDKYTLERVGVLNFQAAIVYRPWVYSKEAYMNAKINEDSYVIPKTATISQLYKELDVAKSKLPLMYTNTIAISDTKDGIKIRGDAFFKNFFRDTSLFGASLNKEEYIMYLLGGGDTKYVKNTKKYFDKRASEERYESVNKILSLLKNKKDIDIVKNEGGFLTTDKLSEAEELFISNIKDLSQLEHSNLDYYVKNIYQFLVDSEDKENGTRVTALLRFYNLPNEITEDENPDLLNFRKSHNAYAYEYTYIPDDYNQQPLSDSIYVIQHIYDDVKYTLNKEGIQELVEDPSEESTTQKDEQAETEETTEKKTEDETEATASQE